MACQAVASKSKRSSVTTGDGMKAAAAVWMQEPNSLAHQRHLVQKRCFGTAVKALVLDEWETVVYGAAQESIGCSNKSWHFRTVLDIGSAAGHQEVFHVPRLLQGFRHC